MKFEKIYFDMDGVLVDFKRGITELAGVKSDESEDEMWDKVRAVDHFYYKLQPLGNQLEIFRLVNEKYKGIVEILTAIPKPKRNILNAKSDKIAWIYKNIGCVPINIVYSSEKKNYAKKDTCILIDDRLINIKEWENSGGTGIFFSKDTNILEILENLEKGVAKKKIYKISDK